MDTRELRDAYRRLARWYDLAEALPEMLGIGRLRRRMLARARGNVLEVAAGTGNDELMAARSIRPLFDGDELNADVDTEADVTARVNAHQDDAAHQEEA